MKLVYIIFSILIFSSSFKLDASSTDEKKIRKVGNCPACNLVYANLRGLNLEYKNLNEANLRGANLRGVNLWSTLG